MTGKFIALDGCDGAVLKQQTAQLAAWLRERGVPVIVTHEPSDGPVGGQLRQVLAGRLTIAALPEPLLALADRIDHLHKKPDGILAQLAAGKWVICERYLLSAVAEYATCAPVDWLARINRPCPWPDLTVLCDTEDNEKKRGEYRAATEFYRDEGREIVVIDGEDTAALRNACGALLGQGRGEAA